jgi:hypothetical protein
MMASTACTDAAGLRFPKPSGRLDKLRAILAAADCEVIDILEEPDHVEVPVGQVLRSVPQKDSPFPGQEHSPLLNVGDEEWAAIDGETCARLEQQARNGVFRRWEPSCRGEGLEPARTPCGCWSPTWPAG